MHEVALTEAVVRIVLEHARAAGAERIVAIRLEIGQFSHVEPDAMRFCFDAVTAGTPVAGARLEIARVPGRAWCHDCAAEVAIPHLGAECPVCGGGRLRVSEGDDLRVKEMEVA